MRSISCVYKTSSPHCSLFIPFSSLSSPFCSPSYFRRECPEPESPGGMPAWAPPGSPEPRLAPPKRPKRPSWGPTGAPWWPKRRRVGEWQDGIRAQWSDVGSGVIHCRCIRGGPQYSACMHPSAIGLVAECRYLRHLPFWLKWQLLDGKSDQNSHLKFQRM